MPKPKRKTPPGKGGVGDRLGGWSQGADSLAASRAQFLIAAHHVRPELAAMLAGLAFGAGG